MTCGPVEFQTIREEIGVPVDVYSLEYRANVVPRELKHCDSSQHTFAMGVSHNFTDIDQEVACNSTLFQVTGGRFVSPEVSAVFRHPFLLHLCDFVSMSAFLGEGKQKG